MPTCGRTDMMKKQAQRRERNERTEIQWARKLKRGCVRSKLVRYIIKADQGAWRSQHDLSGLVQAKATEMWNV